MLGPEFDLLPASGSGRPDRRSSGGEPAKGCSEQQEHALRHRECGISEQWVTSPLTTAMAAVSSDRSPRTLGFSASYVATYRRQKDIRKQH